MSLFGKRKDEEQERSDRTGVAAARSPNPSTPKTARPVPAGRQGATGDPVSGSRNEGRNTGRGSNVKDEIQNSIHNSGDTKSPTTGGEMATIGKSIVFKGELSGDEDLEIDGNVEGDIKLPNHVLTIGAHGKVKATVEAKCVQVIGHITGNITATERVEVEASGVVEGDIRAPRLLVQEGAVVNGSIDMSAGRASASGQPTAAKPALAEQPRKTG